MPAAFVFLAALIGATPVILVFDGLVTRGGVAAAIAIATAFVAFSIRPGEAIFLRSAIRSLTFLAAVPFLWMTFQILPIDIAANPIWQSASAAIGSPLRGSTSIDPGAGLLAIVEYVAAFAIAVLAASVSADRQRAGVVLTILTAMAGVTALVALLVFRGSSAGDPTAASASAAIRNCAGIGVILAAGLIVRSFDRANAQQRSGDAAAGARFLFAFVLSLCAATACLIALVINASAYAFAAVGFGLVTLIALLVSRSLQLGLWGHLAIAATALVAALAVAAAFPPNLNLDPTLAFTARPPAPMTTIAQRMLADSSWTGSGAGSFADLLPIYRGTDPIGNAAPTTAVQIAIELGRPMLWIIVLLGTVLALQLMRGALQRGRDAIFPATGAACIVTLILLAFCDAGLLSTAPINMAAATVGLAIAQRKSRTI